MDITLIAVWGLISAIIFSLGYILKDKLIGYAGATLFLLLGVTIIASGIETQTGKYIETKFSYDNITYGNTTGQDYILKNATRNETINFRNDKTSNWARGFGVILTLVGIYSATTLYLIK